MENTVNKFAIPFKKILYGDDSFILDTGTVRYRLTTGIGEHYIMMNLTGECKSDGVLVARLGESKRKPALLPVAVRHGDKVTRIATEPDDDDTEIPPLSGPSPFDRFIAGDGDEYPDGFIDASRTSLSYEDVMFMEKQLHGSDYVPDFYRIYRQRYPDTPLYDARLHYFMIKGIRKHKHYTDDFILPCDDFTFYPQWRDPFPWFLYTETFAGVNSWPSHAKMRLMADNGCFHGIPVALKVLHDGKANDRIKHYAIVLAGMDQANDGLVMQYKDKFPRAVGRVLYERRSPDLFPMLLDNANRILAGVNDDILDDHPVIHTGVYDRMEEYTINHRGFIRLDNLTEDQVRELWDVYRQIAQRVVKADMMDEGLRLGNAFRAFLLALIFNETAPVAEIIEDIYRNFNFLLYSEWSQDSKYRRMDLMWLNYLYELVVKWEILDNFWSWLQFHAKKYDHYYLYTNQHFFLMAYSKVAYHMLDPATFYDALAPLIDENYVLVESIWPGVTGDNPLGESDPPLDHRWENMFCEYNYYVWTAKTQFYYRLVKHRINPHPVDWAGKWHPVKKKLKIAVPR